MTTEQPPIGPNDPAPTFALPAIGREGTVSLDDYRGRSPVLLALFRGLWCPFCRRAIAQLGVTTEKLKHEGVETLAVVATSPENANLYFRFRPTRAPLAADPDMTMFRAFRLPKPPVNEELMKGMQTVTVNPTGELPAPMPLAAVGPELDRIHGFTRNETDQKDFERQFPQLKGQFLIDRDGIVRWAHIEGLTEGLAGVGKFPTDDELVAAARTLR